jgi:hypothetical protein
MMIVRPGPSPRSSLMIATTSRRHNARKIHARAWKRSRARTFPRPQSLTGPSVRSIPPRGRTSPFAVIVSAERLAVFLDTVFDPALDTDSRSMTPFHESYRSLSSGEQSVTATKQGKRGRGRGSSGDRKATRRRAVQSSSTVAFCVLSRRTARSASADR